MRFVTLGVQMHLLQSILSETIATTVATVTAALVHMGVKDFFGGGIKKTVVCLSSQSLISM